MSVSRALELAAAARQRAYPKPTVGAVLVRDGEIVGEGATEASGRHAEAVALTAAGDRARGATLYVTLEPCAHHGTTPPCADALVAAGVERVVFAARDPNPEAAGGEARDFCFWRLSIWSGHRHSASGLFSREVIGRPRRGDKALSRQARP